VCFGQNVRLEGLSRVNESREAKCTDPPLVPRQLQKRQVPLGGEDDRARGKGSSYWFGAARAVEKVWGGNQERGQVVRRENIVFETTGGTLLTVGDPGKMPPREEN